MNEFLSGDMSMRRLEVLDYSFYKIQSILLGDFFPQLETQLKKSHYCVRGGYSLDEVNNSIYTVYVFPKIGYDDVISMLPEQISFSSNIDKEKITNYIVSVIKITSGFTWHTLADDYCQAYYLDCEDVNKLRAILKEMNVLIPCSRYKYVVDEFVDINNIPIGVIC